MFGRYLALLSDTVRYQAKGFDAVIFCSCQGRGQRRKIGEAITGFLCQWCCFIFN